MAVISHVFTIRRVSQLLGREEDLLREIASQLEPEDGMLWVYDVGDSQILAFTQQGIEMLPAPSFSPASPYSSEFSAKSDICG